MMVRIATVQDAEQLEILNNEFNGEGETTLDNIRRSLASNKQEVTESAISFFSISQINLRAN